MEEERGEWRGSEVKGKEGKEVRDIREGKEDEEVRHCMYVSDTTHSAVCVNDTVCVSRIRPLFKALSRAAC